MNDHVEVKRALLIGISYETSETEASTSNEISPLQRSSTQVLKGTHNDVQDVRDLLIEVFDYREEDIILMTDELSTNLNLIPTRSNIIDQLKNFIHPDEPNARYFFLYAGHSHQIKCEDGSEEDEMNEYIIPSDAFDTYRSIASDELEEDEAAEEFIMDNILHEYLVRPLERSNTRRLTAVLDTCHSGTLLDLPHYRCNRYNRRFTAIKRRIHRRFSEFGRFLRSPSIGQVAHYVSGITSPYTNDTIPQFCKGSNCPRITARGQPSVICISACKDLEFTLEETMGRGSGLLTSAFIKALRKEDNSNPKLKHLMRFISSEVDKDVKKAKKAPSWRGRKRTYAQNPQLSSDIPADMSLPLGM
ncbi:peptidase C14 [Dendrothele bispora CBS 962.96]|uniref:Peptidase C14 n=1 Tax=Dendrothele bispora (strain CBS 962.96) TaxID=1314807 RepID=A0A4S8M6D6_DENBC|nr:peptidase C14 [Dendrothele bispora CBS 962.96]